MKWDNNWIKTTLEILKEAYMDYQDFDVAEATHRQLQDNDITMMSDLSDWECLKTNNVTYQVDNPQLKLT